MKTKLIVTFISALAYGSSALAVDCFTDCGKVASFSYPCPSARNPRRRCEGRDPATYGACTAAKEAACRILEPIENALVHDLAMDIAEDPQVTSASKKWTTTSCKRDGGLLITAVGAGFASPLCVAAGIQTAGVATAGCALFLATSGALITDVTCTQLCTDRQLEDCK